MNSTYFFYQPDDFFLKWPWWSLYSLKFMGKLAYWVAVNAHWWSLYKTIDPTCEPSSLPFSFLWYIENMGSIWCLFMFMRFLLLLSPVYLMVANSSSSMQQPLCHGSESSALLQFKQSFLIDEHVSNNTAAHGMVLSVIGRLVMSSAFTLPAVVSMVLSIPAVPSSILFISGGLTSLIIISTTLRSHLVLVSFQGLGVSISLILDSLGKSRRNS